MKTVSRFLLLCAALAASWPLAGAGDAAKTRELLGVLRSDAPLAARARACQQLAVVGTPDAVPALAALLGDDKLAHYAREALEAMADPAADAALREALGRLQGPALVGAVNSLGARGDRGAVPALQKLAADPASPAAGAALFALARIGTPEALATVRTVLTAGPAALRGSAAEAGLLAADRLSARGATAEAVAWYDAVRALPGQVQRSALRGALLARGADGLPLLVDTLRSPDAETRAVALRALRDLSGAAVAPAVVAVLDSLSPESQALVIAALADRGESSALTAIEARATAADPAVRLAALKALGRIGRASSVPLLLRVLGESPAPADTEAAQRSLAQLTAPETADLVRRALAAASPALRLKLITVLAERGAEQATPDLLALAADGDAATRRAALRGLALLARPRDLPALIQLSLTAGEDDLRTLADRAIYAASMKILEPERRAAPLLEALAAAGEPARRAALLRPLGAVVRAMGGNAAARTAVEALLADAANEVRDAAVKTLADWPDAGALPTLLAFLRGSPTPDQRSVAFAGAVRMAGNLALGRDKTPGDALATLTELNAAVRTDGERMAIVSALGGVRRIEALRLLAPYLDVPAVATETALAAIQIAPPLLRGPTAAETKRVLEKIAAAERDPDVRARAAVFLASRP